MFCSKGEPVNVDYTACLPQQNQQSAYTQIHSPNRCMLKCMESFIYNESIVGSTVCVCVCVSVLSACIRWSHSIDEFMYKAHKKTIILFVLIKPPNEIHCKKKNTRRTAETMASKDRKKYHINYELLLIESNIYRCCCVYRLNMTN